MQEPTDGTAVTVDDGLRLPELLLESPVVLMLQLLRVWKRRAEESGGPLLPQIMVLACLEEFGPASQRDIARRLRWDPSDLVSVIDRLEDDGLARREKDPTDRRRHAVVLTDDGRRWMGDMGPRLRGRNRRLLPSLDDDERRELVALLRRALTAVDASVTDGRR